MLKQGEWMKRLHAASSDICYKGTTGKLLRIRTLEAASREHTDN